MNGARWRAILLLLTISSLRLTAAGPAKTLAALNAQSRDLFLASMEWGDRYWDARANFIWSFASDRAAPRHLVRETSWYALGLLIRNRPRDKERAVQALNAVLDQQFEEPEERWNGTFYRAPEEPHPAPTARMWTNYDPNWREFIGTTFALILTDFGDQLPVELTKRLDLSIEHAVDGEIHEQRLKPTYTNIALMYGFLWNFAGTRYHRAEWVNRSLEWSEEVYAEFKQHNSFPEYNSPTYCGVDLYGLALWRVYGSTPRMRRMGADMEAALWRDLAAFYHPGLQNLDGPFDRAYGMDMRRYISIVGLWLGTVLDRRSAPLPELKQPLEHADDLIFVPCMIATGTSIPDDAMQNFRVFSEARFVTRDIVQNRVATAWLGKTVMLGGEYTRKSKESGPGSQFHPATIYWSAPGDDVGWVQLIQSPRVDARASKNKLLIEGIGDSKFRIHIAGVNPADIQRSKWNLPGLAVDIDTDAEDVKFSSGPEFVDVLYRKATRFVLTTRTPAQNSNFSAN